MPEPHTNGLERALSVAVGLAEVEDLSAFPSRTSQLLRELIPCDHAGYNVIDVPSGTAAVVADPVDVVFDGGPETLARFGNQSPLIVRAQAGDIDALRLSDHITQLELHRTDLYQHVYRQVGLEYQLVMQLPPLRRELGRPQEVVGVSLSRYRHDFSDHDKDLLQLLRPILAGTLERLQDVAFLRAIADGDGDDRGVVFVDGHGVVAWATSAGRELLDVEVGAALPETIRQWIAAQGANGAGARETVITPVGGRRLRLRLVPDAYAGLDAVHVSPTRPLSDPTRLCQRLGLTPRQADVLASAMDGCDTPQIAHRLGLSPRTVGKHFEAIYTHLGVRTRSQAVIAAFEDLAG
ncbi:MAG: helix-turn-helix transcriptional regulator [Acidimicrobiales bacterium]|nr:helix-turn-helix transcriptional regulator [Acidimicrobiales bacterium]